MMNKLTLSAVALVSAAVPIMAAAVDFDVTIQNISRGLYFTPLLVAAHPDSERIFSANTTASAALQAMAEGGDISALSSSMTGVGATQANNPAGGLLAPGANTTITLNTDSSIANTQLSIVGMILPSNDGFLGLNAIDIPAEAGTYIYNINAYDAGTEANDELRGSGTPGVQGMPVPPPLDPQLGNSGSGVTTAIEGYIHIHRGSLGDNDANGGLSDIDNTVHRWLNPVARITIMVR